MFIFKATIKDNLLVKDDVAINLQTVQEISKLFRNPDTNTEADHVINNHVIKRKYSDKLLAIEIDNVLFHITDLGIAEFLLTRGLTDADATFLYKDKYKIAYYKIGDFLYAVQDNIKDSRFAEYSISSLLAKGLFEVDNAEELYKDREYKGDFLFTDATGKPTYLEPFRAYGNVKATYLVGHSLGMGFSKSEYKKLLDSIV